MIKILGYEFDNGRWVARWEFIDRVWIDLKYPQNNTSSAGRFIEPSYVFAPADRFLWPYLQASSADITNRKLEMKRLSAETSTKFFLQVHDEVGMSFDEDAGTRLQRTSDGHTQYCPRGCCDKNI